MKPIHKDLRCLHVDYDQPPLESDAGQELHRRCIALVPYEPGELPEEYAHLSGFCALHRIRYASDGQPASRAQVAEAKRRVKQFAAHLALD